MGCNACPVAGVDPCRRQGRDFLLREMVKKCGGQKISATVPRKPCAIHGAPNLLTNQSFDQFIF
ncbi:hypothetical protein CKO51_01325 [Rhodopirellula sp. SM50]|nr:hypothetical protein CKO51_01325 [Rhodopirellula sp. SM50]